jgi:hypothetical protein
MLRAGVALILISQLLLLALLSDTTESRAIGFSFLGHPALAAGVVVAVVALLRARRV